jgi:hypothetical protein
VYYAYLQLDYHAASHREPTAARVAWQFRVNGLPTGEGWANDSPAQRVRANALPGAGSFATTTLLHVEQGDEVGVWCDGCAALGGTLVSSSAQAGFLLVEAPHFLAVNRHPGRAPLRWRNELGGGGEGEAAGEGTLIADRVMLESGFAYAPTLGLAEPHSAGLFLLGGHVAYTRRQGGASAGGGAGGEMGRMRWLLRSSTDAGSGFQFNDTRCVLPPLPCASHPFRYSDTR